MAFLRQRLRSVPSSPPSRFALGLAFVKSRFPRLYAPPSRSRMISGARAFPDTSSFPRIHPSPDRTSIILNGLLILIAYFDSQSWETSATAAISGFIWNFAIVVSPPRSLHPNRA